MCDCAFTTWHRRWLSITSSTCHEELDDVYLDMLDPQFHPIAPDKDCQQSVQVFEQHKQGSLMALHRNLRRQLEIMKGQRGNASDDGWVVVSRQDHTPLT